MRIAIVTDAWRPQTNGVVTTLGKTGAGLTELGHTVLFVTPESFRTVPLPTYPEIRLSLFPYSAVRRMLDTFAPEAVHIATEGPLGFSARRYCRRAGLRFTTSYHTQFPRYLRMRAPIPEKWSYAFLRWFHSAAERTMVPTESQRQELLDHGFRNVALWTRGVDIDLFRPRARNFLRDRRPIFIYAGRVAVEKNLEAFLALALPGTKYVVGDGPDLPMLKRKYPEVRFTGYKFGEELASHYAAADVFVFPSRTDTFGLVLLEAMACGVPVAAFPVTGPIDVVQNGVTGILGEDLRAAALAALQLDAENCRDYALQHSWEAATDQFAANLAPNAVKRSALPEPVATASE